MLKVAIVGCGKIADDHLQQIRRIPGGEVVAACDLEPLMAQQLCERFHIRNAFVDVAELLEKCRPDVVHITTPPHSHFPLAIQCLRAGCHVYVEKPFALNGIETEKILALAEEKQRKVTVGHDLQFSPTMQRMRELIKKGYLGEFPVHMESYYCYDLTDANYAKALLSDKNHWIRRLPGKLLQNIISHGIARIAEFIPGDSPHVFARGFVSPLLRSIGEVEIVDELRVVIVDAATTAYFTFSSQMRPSLNFFRLYGARNGLELDQNRETLLKLHGSALKSYAEKFLPPFDLACQELGNIAINFRKFLSNDFHMKSGMKRLIELFYRSIMQDAPPPIPYREILLTSRIMDTIFDQLTTRNAMIAAGYLQRYEDAQTRIVSGNLA